MVQAAKLMGAGSALIALAGVGAGIGIVFGSLIQSAGRNPLMAKQLMGYALLGFALCESIALFTLLVAFLILFSSISKARSGKKKVAGLARADFVHRSVILSLFFNFFT